MIPDLDERCNSWIVVERKTGRAVAEFFERSTVEQINQEKYQVFTSLEYVRNFNREINS